MLPCLCVMQLRSIFAARLASSALTLLPCQHCLVADVMSVLLLPANVRAQRRSWVQARSCRSCRRSGNRSLRSRRRVTCCSCRRDGRMRFSTCARGLGWRRSSSSRTGSDESERRNQYHTLGLAPCWRHPACQLSATFSQDMRSRQARGGRFGMPQYLACRAERPAGRIETSADAPHSTQATWVLSI